tara:strand:+ start:1873 stop:2259 length:387 start_codon:yes stop_codon:yes gene_type:complete
MSDRVDALFSGNLPQPTPDAGNRILRLQRVLYIAIALDVLGIPCWTSVPGSVLTLWVWLSTDTDVSRIENGEYTDTEAVRLMRLRKITSWALAFCVCSLVIQIGLLSTTFYERFWGSISVAIQHILNP